MASVKNLIRPEITSKADEIVDLIQGFFQNKQKVPKKVIQQARDRGLNKLADQADVHNAGGDIWKNRDSNKTYRGGSRQDAKDVRKTMRADNISEENAAAETRGQNADKVAAGVKTDFIEDLRAYNKNLTADRQKLLEEGKKLGYSGNELKNYVQKQMDKQITDEALSRSPGIKAEDDFAEKTGGFPEPFISSSQTMPATKTDSSAGMPKGLTKEEQDSWRIRKKTREEKDAKDEAARQKENAAEAQKRAQEEDANQLVITDVEREFPGQGIVTGQRIDKKASADTAKKPFWAATYTPEEFASAPPATKQQLLDDRRKRFKKGMRSREFHDAGPVAGKLPFKASELATDKDLDAAFDAMIEQENLAAQASKTLAAKPESKALKNLQSEFKSQKTADTTTQQAGKQSAEQEVFAQKSIKEIKQMIDSGTVSAENAAVFARNYATKHSAKPNKAKRWNDFATELESTGGRSPAKLVQRLVEKTSDFNPKDSVTLPDGKTMTRKQFIKDGGSDKDFNALREASAAPGKKMVEDGWNIKNIKEIDVKITDIDKQIAERKTKAERLSKKKPKYRTQELDLEREKANNDAELAKLEKKKSNLSKQRETLTAKTSPEALSKLQQTAKQNNDFVGPPKAGEEPTSSPLPPGPAYKEILAKSPDGVSFTRVESDYATFNKQTGFEAEMDKGLYNVKFLKEDGSKLAPEEDAQLKKGILEAKKEGSAGLANYAKKLAAGGIILGVGGKFLSQPTPQEPDESRISDSPTPGTRPTPTPATSADFSTSEKLKQIQALDKQLVDPKFSPQAKAALQAARDRILNTIPENERPKTTAEPTEEQIKTEEDKRVALFKQGIFGPETSGTARPYEAENPGSSAVGKYQFLWNTWGDSIAEYAGKPGLTREEYKTNPDLQEKWMDHYARNLLPGQANNLLEKFTPEQMQQRGINNNLELMALLHYQGPKGANYYLEKGEMYPWKDKEGKPVVNLPVQDYISKFSKSASGVTDAADFGEFKRFNIRKQKTTDGSLFRVDNPQDLADFYATIKEKITPMSQLSEAEQERFSTKESELTQAINDAKQIYQNSVKQARSDAERRENVLAFARIGEMIGQALVKYMAAREGKRLGQRIGSDLKFEQYDWNADLDRSMEKLKTDLASAKEEFGIVQKEVETGQEQLAKERAGVEDRRYKEAQTYLKAALDEREQQSRQAARERMDEKDRAFQAAQNAAKMTQALKIANMRIEAEQKKLEGTQRKQADAIAQAESAAYTAFTSLYNAKGTNKKNAERNKFLKEAKALELTGPEIDEINRLAERPGWWDTEENMLKAQAIFQQARIRKLSSFGAALEAVTPAQQKDPYQEYLELDAKFKAAANAGGK